MEAPAQNLMSYKLSVILPIYNTGDCLEELHQRLCKTLESCVQNFELIMVDDGSPDNAHEKLVDIAHRDARVKALFLSRNFGQHPAISAGLEHANGDVIVLMDADLQDRPEDIPFLLAQLEPDVDIVYTVKSNPEESFFQLLTSRFYHYVFSRITCTKVPNKIGTLRVFRNVVQNALLRYPERNVLYGPLMFFVGFRSTTVTVHRPPRPRGRSGYTFTKRLVLALNSLLSYTDIPHRLLMGSGFGILCLTALYILALLARYFLDDTPIPPGLTLLALLITGSLGVTMFALGIIGTYIFRVYQEVLARPRYLLLRAINLEPAQHITPSETKHENGGIPGQG